MALIRSEAATIVGYLTLLCVTLLGGLLTPESVGWQISAAVFAGLFCVMLWLAFAVVRHAEGLATLLGEPYGTLILTLSVIGIEVALIASIGLFIAMEELYRLAFGPYGISFNQPPLQTSVNFLGMHLKLAEIITMLGAGILIGALALLSLRTRIGVAWRATVTMPEIAESFGINIEHVRYINFFVGSALAGAAGVMVAVLNNLVEPTMGSVPSYKALAIIVLGGLGDVRGTLIAALALGIIEAYGTIYLGQLLDRDAIAFTFLIVVLMIRPQGLFGKAIS